MRLFRSILFSLVLVFLWGGGVFFFLEEDIIAITERESILERRKSLLARLEALPQKEELIQKKLEELNEQAVDQFLYSGEHSVIQSLLQRDIRKIAGEVKVNIGTIRSLGGLHEVGTLRRSSVQLTISDEFSKLLTFLDAIERHTPMLHVRKLSIRTVSNSTVSTPAQLATIIEVSAYSKPAEEGGPA